MTSPTDINQAGEGEMTPEKIKELTPEQYGGDFELTSQIGEEV